MEIKMPQLGESVTEGTIARWLVKPGDAVKKYDPLAEVVTDKVNTEIPSPTDGVIQSLEVEEGQTVGVGTLIARMQVEGEEEAPAPAADSSAGTPAGAANAPAETPAAAGSRVEAPVAAPLAAKALETQPAGVRYSPAVMRLAQEHGVDLTQLKGTGLGGRITRKDVERYLEDRAAGRVPAAQVGAGAGAQPSAGTGVPAAAAPAAAPQAPGVPGAAGALAGSGDQRIPVGPVRRRIAERMVQAKHEQPHAWTMVRADVTGLVALRNSRKADFKAREGVDLTYLPFMIKAVAESLREYPILNSVWAGEEIVVRREVNISIAVATDDALVVPVIKNADRLSIPGLAHAVADLAARARAGKLSLDDVQGGTFTVNNTGAFGSVMSAPILNYPQAAIITMESIVKEPVVLENDAIAIRSMVNLCLSLDHRVLDGLVAGRFLQAVKRRLESYQPGQDVL